MKEGPRIHCSPAIFGEILLSVAITVPFKMIKVQGDTAAKN
jgi:hypothetical protein